MKITEGLFRKNSTLWKSNNNVRNIIHLGRSPPKFWGPRLQPIQPIGKSGTGPLASIDNCQPHSYLWANILHVWLKICKNTSILQIRLNIKKNVDLPGLNNTNAFRHAYSVVSTRFALSLDMTSCTSPSCAAIRELLSPPFASNENPLFIISVPVIHVSKNFEQLLIVL